MSSNTIARWDAIPMIGDSGPAASANKRSRSDAEHNDDDSSEDNVSLVSRSPSPAPPGDVEMKDVNLYDEHVRGTAREVITVETKIRSSNKGFAMLAKMGWAEGTPLGISGEGRVDPVPFTIKQDSMGLGKITQDVRMIETTVSQRRNLDSERMQFETAEQREKREYDEHTNSYAHHHKARMKDMNANHPMKVGGKEEAEKRKEKERKREEKELRKMAKAVGIKMSTPSAAAGLATVSSTPALSAAGGRQPASSTSTPAAAPSVPSSGGWAA
ncbi:hypothetical protein EW145_g8574, partial [Phellinidium pouzarii]